MNSSSVFGRRTYFRSVLLVACLLVAAACSSSEVAVAPDEPGATAALEATTEATTDDANSVETGSDLEVAARQWISGAADLGPAVQESIRLVATDRAGNVSHLRFEQYYDDRRVEDAELTVHVLGDGTVQGATSSLAEIEPAAEVAVNVDEAGAVAIVAKTVTGTTDGSPSTMLVWIVDGGRLRSAWRVDVATVGPRGSWTVHIDTASGSVIRSKRTEMGRASHASGLGSRAAGLGASKVGLQQGGDRCELPPAPSACVFRPDPIFAAGGRLDNPATANSFLTGVSLEGLDDPASGALIGQFANLEPAGAPIAPTRQPDAMWGAGRADAGFEAQNSYYWIDYGQRTVQRLGFDSMRNESFPVVPVDPETVDNAFYSPSEGKIYLGVGSNGIHEGEDATGILHEYGHALLDAVNPNLLSGGDIGAYHEGFGDIFAMLVTLEFRTGDWPCFFAWTDQECIRRMDTNKVYPRDLVRQIHSDGEIYSGAIADILRSLLVEQGIDIDTCPGTTACNELRDRVLTTVLASNYYLAENSSMPDIAAAFVQANEAQYAGADADLIDAAFSARGLSGGSGTLIDAQGNSSGSAASVAVELDIAHSYRGDLRIEVGVVDADFEPLCTPVVILEPDENDDETDVSGVIDLSDTDCAPLGQPSPDRIWYLLVEDTLADDEGQIVAFSVSISGQRYPAPGLPLPIADADPNGSAALIDGSFESMSQQGMQPMAPTAGDGAYITASLTHSYHGDLSIRAGVADADSTIICSVPVLDPDPADSSSGQLNGDIDMSECGELFPPSPDRQWFLQVIDTAAEDQGTIDVFSLTGNDGSVFEFLDVPVNVPDNDVDGVALLLDGDGGSSGQAGGGGRGADVGLPGASIRISHPYAGDLAVSGGVLDAAGNVLCEVTLHTPDANNDSVDLVGDVSLGECARHYPPAPERPWFLFVADTLSDDTGTVDEFSLFGDDGSVYTFAGLPRPVPDADPNGVVLELDGSEFGVGDAGEPVVGLVVSHPYIGDLDISVGVLDAADEIICVVTVTEADFDNDGVDLAVHVPMGECADFYPPAPDRQWYAFAVDVFEFDKGRIEAFALYGPDGTNWIHADTPVAIPDEDLDGVVVVIDGNQESPAAPAATGQAPVVDLRIAHPYRGDLRITVGVVDANDTILCEQVLSEPDIDDDGADFTVQVPVAECAEFFPPGSNRRWFLLVSDESADDEGTVERFAIRGPGARGIAFEGGPVPIPDADVDGVVLTIP